MGCLSCFDRDEDPTPVPPQTAQTCGVRDPTPVPTSTFTQEATQALAASSKPKSAQTFNFRELAVATRNFRKECLLGEGGFGRVFKGELHTKGIVVAVKQLDRTGLQENIEFVEEVMNLSHLNHPNLVDLIGYCADGSQRILVYEFVSNGSLQTHLFGEGEDRKLLDWNTRMNIACGIANGLHYLHEKANPPVIYRRLKPSNVLLDEDLAPKLSDYGLTKLSSRGGGSDCTNQSATMVMSTFGYSAPEQTRGEDITIRSDIYCFGIILLELITGRRVVDTTRPSDEQNLVTWAQPFFKNPKRFSEMADPRLNNAFPVSGLNQAVGIAAMCLQEEPSVRPMVGDIATALSVIAMSPYNPTSPSVASFSPPTAQKMEYDSSSATDSEHQTNSSSVGTTSCISDSNNGSSNDGSEESSVFQYDSATVDDSSCESGNYQACGDSEEKSKRTQQGGDSLYESNDETSSSNEDDESREDGSSSVSTKETSKTDSVESVSSSSTNITTSTSTSNSGKSSKSSESSSRSKKPKKKKVTFREPSLNSRHSTSKKNIEEAGMVSETPDEQDEVERASSSSSSSDEEDSGAKSNNASDYPQRAPRKGSKSSSKPRKGSKPRKQRRGKNADGASDHRRPDKPTTQKA